MLDFTGYRRIPGAERNASIEASGPDRKEEMERERKSWILPEQPADGIPYL